ncbi:uncharacterized protein BDCG_07028 [Blastomyces dermatitidis ER-3]|uniref:Uncharacterized protein n=1 Tax=Ajellomyces dermatitidis (strain ER-3 / ATCC MYA-2586) TaxID=559297 RepID=A0ABP2F6D6_AJEDR|nr:uncharacterized protein BDCG_07028 [Blastomyces dermatitidis ER-3]EEQ91908.2 hypothetical protein BDCG_07028 [Blastomyces dermatitidis ER-3]
MNHGVVFPRIAKDSPRHLVYSVDSCDWLPSDSECDGLDGIFHSKACQTNVRVFKTQKSRSMELVHELTALRTLVGPAFIASLVIPSMTRSSWRAGQGVRGCNIMNTTSRTPPMSQRSSRMDLLLFIRTMFLIVTVLLLFLFEYFSSLPSFLVVYEMVITEGRVPSSHPSSTSSAALLPHQTRQRNVSVSEDYIVSLDLLEGTYSISVEKSADFEEIVVRSLRGTPANDARNILFQCLLFKVLTTFGD